MADIRPQIHGTVNMYSQSMKIGLDVAITTDGTGVIYIVTDALRVINREHKTFH